MSLSSKYLSFLAKECFMMGALCARVNLASHSSWTTLSTSSLSVYSTTAPCFNLCTLRTWELWGSFTTYLILVYILIFSSLSIFCLMALARSLSFFSCAEIRHSWGGFSWGIWLASWGRWLLIYGILGHLGFPLLLSLLGFWCSFFLHFFLTLLLFMHLCVPCLSLMLNYWDIFWCWCTAGLPIS